MLPTLILEKISSSSELSPKSDFSVEGFGTISTLVFAGAFELIAEKKSSSDWLSTSEIFGTAGIDGL
jgi:hypothetical protein